MNNKRLYKSTTDRVLFGVCGGIAEYFDADPVIVRLLMVVFALTGAGVLFYILAAIIIRERNEPAASRSRPASAASCGADEAESYSGEAADAEAAPGASASYAAPNAKRAGGRSSGAMIVGLILILIGVFYLINRFVPIFYWVDLRAIFAVALVLAGIYFVAKR
ncbi:MAG: PspC domain-containing protein [Clostridiales Family XIII bacterium]|jgi:phage shock protein PspC (stress-responsive transcriptional regulator)|nr:PspC domain-containing protein [Clostridiales Family XIII bacterium]